MPCVLLRPQRHRLLGRQRPAGSPGHGTTVRRGSRFRSQRANGQPSGGRQLDRSRDFPSSLCGLQDSNRNDCLRVLFLEFLKNRPVRRIFWNDKHATLQSVLLQKLPELLRILNH